MRSDKSPRMICPGMPIAFAGAGVGAIVLLPWLQSIILSDGWRASCWAIGMLVVLGVAPLNLLVRKETRGDRIEAGRRGSSGFCLRAASRGSSRRSCLGRHRVDAGTSRTDGALLVDRARLLLRPR